MGHDLAVKICPACSREYGDEHETCLDDGVVLVRLDTGTNTRAQDLIGSVVDGRYRVERIVGRGGMGTVYACRHVVVGKPFAMKVLRPGIERSEEILQRFIREAQAANAVKSRHICEMTDFGQLANGAFYVVMELLEGVSLTRALREQRLDRKGLKHVFVQIADTLFRAHNANIIHRDLKPDNVVLVNDEGDPNFVKLVDFGIAKMMQSKASNLTETGVILGTPYYMSPEQARGDELDHRSDIYALGVMMYRAFTGRLPFVADTAMGVLTRHLTEKPELPSRITDIDPTLERLILRCLEKKPIDRFQTMEDVAKALRALRDTVGPADFATTIDDRGGDDELPDLSPEGPESGATPTRLASPMARSQRREAWDGSRAEVASAPVPRSQPPPRPRSNPPVQPQIPAPVPLPMIPGPPAPRSNLPLPYPHHLTPQAMAVSAEHRAHGHTHGSERQSAELSSGEMFASEPTPGAYQGVSSTGAHAISNQHHPVYQPVTGAMRAHPGMEPPLPAHLQGEAATNRGVSARIGVLPQQTPRRWPLLAGLAVIAIVGLAVGAVALIGTGGDGAPATAASSAPEAEDDQRNKTEPVPTSEERDDPHEEPAPEPALSASADASGAGPTDAAPPTTGRRPVAPRPDGGGDVVKPKPVDDVRDPFGD